jgi:hypothetical protein
MLTMRRITLHSNLHCAAPHTWAGNRVSIADWSQLTLKEGLTVYREQLLLAHLDGQSGDSEVVGALVGGMTPAVTHANAVHTAAVPYAVVVPEAAEAPASSSCSWRRVADARQLRKEQWPEEGGALSHAPCPCWTLQQQPHHRQQQQDSLADDANDEDSVSVSDDDATYSYTVYLKARALCPWLPRGSDAELPCLAVCLSVCLSVRQASPLHFLFHMRALVDAGRRTGAHVQHPARAQCV